jgi:glycine/serine hydroxymethyltransferase
MRGFDEEDMREVGEIICQALSADPPLDELRARVENLCYRRPLYPGFPGHTLYRGR